MTSIFTVILPESIVAKKQRGLADAVLPRENKEAEWGYLGGVVSWLERIVKPHVGVVLCAGCGSTWWNGEGERAMAGC